MGFSTKGLEFRHKRDKDTLEMLFDMYGIKAVVETLVDICHEKSARVGDKGNTYCRRMDGVAGYLSDTAFNLPDPKTGI